LIILNLIILKRKSGGFAASAFRQSQRPRRTRPDDRFDDEFEEEFEDRFEDEFEDRFDEEFDELFEELLPATCQRSPCWARSLPGSLTMAPIAPLGA
jgi:hypothetical protein